MYVSEADIRMAIIKRALLGFPLGIALGTVFMLIESFLYGDGQLYPVAPAMLSWMPSELIATFWQFMLCGILGSSFAGASAFFQIEQWSLAKQTVAHFLVLSVSMTTVSTLCGWNSPLGPNLWAAALFMVTFVVLYIIIWIGIFLYWRNWIKKVNSKLG
jgi:hypothetical protein